MTLEEAIAKIKPLDHNAMEIAQKRWDSIAKPLHSLGKLETLLIQIAGITGNAEVNLSRRGLIVMCADNGVVEEGVTQTGQEVTAIVAENFLKYDTSVGVMCKQNHAEIFPVDMGMVTDTKVRTDHKIAYGTQNMTKGPAMTREQAVKGLEAGIDMVRELNDKGYRILATGEMGIGNTTTSSAVASVLLKQPVEEMTGRGAGLTSEGLVRKINAIKKAIALNEPDPEDAIDVLAKVGGLDIAGMAGVFLGGAVYGIPVVMDGFISDRKHHCAGNTVWCVINSTKCMSHGMSDSKTYVRESHTSDILSKSHSFTTFFCVFNSTAERFGDQLDCF